MFSISQLSKNVIRHVGYAARWLVYEFLPLSVRNTVSSRLTDFSRLLGFVTIVSLMLFETRGLPPRPWAWYAWVLDAVLAILIGNIVKECAIWVSARIANGFGVNFHRRGFMLNGRSFSEIIRSDGTWRRCEFSERETVCEWTDSYGSISRSVTASRLHPGEKRAIRNRVRHT